MALGIEDYVNRNRYKWTKMGFMFMEPINFCHEFNIACYILHDVFYTNFVLLFVRFYFLLTIILINIYIYFVVVFLPTENEASQLCESAKFYNGQNLCSLDSEDLVVGS